MSYSFSVRGANKAEVMDKVDAELAKVVAQQPVHKADFAQARDAVAAFVGVLIETVEKDIIVSASGSLGWDGTLSGLDQALTSASVNVSAGLIIKR